MNCLQATRLLSEMMDRPLTRQEHLRLKIHLTICPGCYHFKQQMPVLRRISLFYALGEGHDKD